MSRMPSTSIGTRSVDVLGARRVVDLVAERVALGRQDHRVLGEHRERHRLLGAGHRARPGTSPTRSSSRRCSTTSRGSDTGSVTTALASSRSATSTASRSDAPSVSRSDSAGATRRISHDERRDERPADRSDDAERRVPGLEPLQHREVLAQRLDLAADGPGPVEHPDAELGRHRRPAGSAPGAARRARPRAGGHARRRSTAPCGAGRRRP